MFIPSRNLGDKHIIRGELTMKKKLLCIIFTAILSLSFITPAYADWDDDWKEDISYLLIL